MPIVDGVVEGDVVPAVHNGENVAIKGKFFDDLAKEVGDAVANISAANDSIAELQGEIAGKQGALTTSDDLSISSDNLLSLTDMAKKRLFIDLFNNAAAGYGSYNPAKAPDATKPFQLYDMWLTYDEAVETYNQWINVAYSSAQPSPKVRALLPISVGASGFGGYLTENAKFFGAINLEVVAFSGFRTYFKSDNYSFQECAKLRSILGNIVYNTVATTVFKGCSALTSITIYELHKNISFSQSPLLSLDSMSFMVQNATNTEAITITVHPDVYAKLTDETNTEWHAVLTAAAAKNISFATV